MLLRPSLRTQGRYQKLQPRNSIDWIAVPALGMGIAAADPTREQSYLGRQVPPRCSTGNTSSRISGCPVPLRLASKMRA